MRYELIIVDNASTDESRQFIESVCAERPNVHAVLLSSNLGGEALNVGMERARGQYIHISENDVEYLPGWDADLLEKFETFPELGQLSPYSPFPQVDRGEIWEEKPASLLTRGGVSIYVADQNLTTTCMVRREVWDKGVRWKNYLLGDLKFPADLDFSADVKDLGYLVAWNDKYVAVTWGHNIQEMGENLPYYLENYSAKPWLGLEGWSERLRERGFRLAVDDSGNYSIVPEEQGRTEE